MAFTPLLGYPTKFGQKQVETIDYTGPTLYVVGGMEFPASNFGWGGFDSGFGGVSQDGTYRAEIRFEGSGARQVAKIVIFDIATGLEAAAIDLHAQVFRLMFFGV